MRTAVIRSGNCPETLLARSVPLPRGARPSGSCARQGMHGRGSTHDLQLHRLPVELDCPNLEVDADGAKVAVRERILCEPQEQTRLHTSCHESAQARKEKE